VRRGRRPGEGGTALGCKPLYEAERGAEREETGPGEGGTPSRALAHGKGYRL